MNELVLRQLKRCKVARIPGYDEDTTHLVIPKLVARDGKAMLPGHYYLIELDDCIVHPPEDSVLHQNWNNNIIPTSKEYKCECIRLMGDMVRIEGVSYDSSIQQDTDKVWGGWIPLKNITIVKELPV